MGDEREREFENYENFYECLTECMKSIKTEDGKEIYRKEIAFRLGLTQQGFSQRLNPAENTPRFGLNDFVLYMVTFDDWRPLDYLNWIKKNQRAGGLQNGEKKLIEVRKQVEIVLRKIDESLKSTDT